MLTLPPFKRLLWPPILVVLGLSSRHHALPDWVIAYVGDVLWGSFFYSLFACARPRWSPSALWLAAVTTTELIEFSQLYRADWANRVRDSRLGALLFGREFLWSDVICVALGASFAWLFHSAMRARQR